MTKIYLTRHGQTQWNLEGRSQGHLDSKLTQRGREQALWLKERLKEVAFDVVYTSSSGRTIETENIIMQGRDVPTKRLDSLREMHFGTWQGRLWDEVKDEDPIRYRNFWEKPSEFIADSGESYQAFIDRVFASFEEIVSLHEDETILIVVHGGVLKALFTKLEQLDMDEFWTQKPYMHSTNLSIVESENGQHKLVLKGCIEHYPENEKNKYD